MFSHLQLSVSLSEQPAMNLCTSCHMTMSVKGVADTVLPARSDSDVMFCLQSDQGLRIDRSLVYSSSPQDRINTQVIYQFALAQEVCTS